MVWLTARGQLQLNSRLWWNCQKNTTLLTAVRIGPIVSYGGDSCGGTPMAQLARCFATVRVQIPLELTGFYKICIVATFC